MLLCVHAPLPWNNSQIVLEADPLCAIRHDWSIASGPEVYSNGYVDWLRYWLHLPPYAGKICRCFELTGSFAKDEREAFSIGEGVVIKAAGKWTLYAFANVVPDFYFNLGGSLTVAMDRV
jgi:hypothetical protein